MTARIAILATFAMTLASFAGTLNVSTTNELSASIAKAAPGDVIVLKNGRWTNAVIHLTCSGAEGRAITLKAETPGQVILTGDSSLDFAGDWLVVEGLPFEKLKTDRTFVDFNHGSDFCRLP